MPRLERHGDGKRWVLILPNGDRYTFLPTQEVKGLLDGLQGGGRL